MTEHDLLLWLAEAEFSQFGECSGPTLDSLIAKGLVQVHEPGEHQSGFAVQGAARSYRAVSLTDAGWSALRTGREP